MKTFLLICVMFLILSVVTVLIYFFVSGVLPIAVMMLLMSVISWIMVCEQVRCEREENQPKSKFYFYFFIFSGIFNLVKAILMFVSGNLTLAL